MLFTKPSHKNVQMPIIHVVTEEESSPGLGLCGKVVVVRGYRGGFSEELLEAPMVPALGDPGSTYY